MQLRSRYFTYPVVMSDGDFYIDSSFVTDVEQSQDGYSVKLLLKAKINNPELEKMLEDGQVVYAHHIECPQTCYRNLVTTTEEEKEYILRDGEVNGIVQVCSFLVAQKDIDRYSNSLFANDYKGFRFNLEKGCILAVGEQVNLRINKIRDDLANTASIFSIIQNIDPLANEVSVNTAGNKITISLPQKTFAIYGHTSEIMDMQPVMHSMLIVPALAYALSEVKASREQLYNFEDYRWFRSVKKACAKIHIELTPEVLANLDAFSVAQKLLDSPIPKAVSFLGAGGDLDEN